MATSDNWGQGSKNNDNGWGKGASNNSNGWGSIHAGSYGHPTTNLTGEGGFVGLLDLYPNAAFATSMRLLRADYSGGLLRIIAYDGASQQGAADIMPYKIGDNYWVDFNSKLENLDATATGRGLTTNDTLADLCSVGVNNYDGLVSVRYNQIGDGNECRQTSISLMPNLVINGSLNTLNGKPSLVNSTQSNMPIDTPINESYLSAFYVMKPNINEYIFFNPINSVGAFAYIADSGSGSSFESRDVGNPDIYINNVLQNITTRGEAFTALNQHSLIEFDGLDTSNTGEWSSMEFFGGPGSFTFLGDHQELILWPLSQSGNRSQINSNINNAYNIY